MLRPPGATRHPRPSGGFRMRRRVALATTAALIVLLAAAVAPAGASGNGSQSSSSFNAKDYVRTHGYLPLRGVETLKNAKAHSEQQVAQGTQPKSPATKFSTRPASLLAPTTG